MVTGLLNMQDARRGGEVDWVMYEAYSDREAF